jgi:hypothetical protein
MQEPDVGIDAGDHFAVEFQHQTQHAMGGRMLWPEIDGEITQVLLVHDQAFGAAFSSPGSTG